MNVESRVRGGRWGRSRVALLVAALVMTVGAAAGLADPIVVNPSFETDTFTVWPGTIGGNGPITGWSNTGGGGLNPISDGQRPYADNGAIPNSAAVNQTANPTTGGQVAFVQANNSTQSLSQLVAGFDPNAWYVLEYREDARTWTNSAITSWASMDGDALNLVPSHTVRSVEGSNSYTRQYHDIRSRVFTPGDGASATLRFSAASGVDNTLLLDNIKLTQIAPSSYRITQLFQDTFSVEYYDASGNGGQGQWNMNYSTPGSRQTGTVGTLGYLELSATSGGENWRTQVDNGRIDGVLLAAASSSSNRSVWVSPNHNFTEAPLAGRQVVQVSLDPSSYAGSYEALIFGMPAPSTSRSAMQSLAQNSGGFGFELQDTGAWAFYDNTALISTGSVTGHTGLYDVRAELDLVDFINGTPLALRMYVDDVLAYSYSTTARGFNYVGVELFGGTDSQMITATADNLLVYNVDAMVIIPEPCTLSLLGLGVLGLLTRRGRRGRSTTRAKEKGVRTVCLIVLGLLAVTGVTQAGLITFGPVLTTDAMSGIGGTYTHAVSGGSAQTVNGVSFSLLNNGTTPANFNWNTFGNTKDAIADNLGTWVPATGGATGPGLLPLLRGFTYSGNGAGPGSHQAFTLSGLTTGTTYETQLYIRQWAKPGDAGYTGREIALTFTNGAEVDTRTFWEDSPTTEGYPSQHSAYRINYRFTALGPTMTLDAAVPGGAPAVSGSFHMYALTNQVAATLIAPTGSTGPGGLERTDVPSSLRLWLKGDAGVESASGVPATDGQAAQFWRDQSGNSNHATQNAGGERANYRTTGSHTINGMPTLDFDSGDDMLGAFGFGANISATYFVVGSISQAAGSGRWDAILTTQNSGTANDGTGFSMNLIAGGTGITFNGATAYAYPGTNPGLNTPFVSAAVDTLNSQSNAYRVANFLNNSQNYLNGDIAEVVVYNRALNSTERIIVSNALGAKYGVVLGADDHYAGDDAPRDYDLDVFGIGRLTATDKVTGAGAAGFGIMEANNSLSDGEWVLAGHGAAVNSDLGYRWARDWYLEKSAGASVDVWMTFDYTDSGLPIPTTVYEALLFSATGSGFYPLAITGTVTGDQISFLVPDSALQSGYYALGTAIPEPASLSLLAIGVAGLLARRRRRRA
ncbi:MAG TPA: PEP-CTERM sorting domain-containing protein [Planctomycetota bacterium]|nr:PEP-CTERM sorting domain-containing protein [Planctomycetota bacterium]